MNLKLIISILNAYNTFKWANIFPDMLKLRKRSHEFCWFRQAGVQQLKLTVIVKTFLADRLE